MRSRGEAVLKAIEAERPSEAVLSTEQLWAEVRRLEKIFEAGAIKAARPSPRALVPTPPAPERENGTSPKIATVADRQPAWAEAVRRTQLQLQQCEEQVARQLVEQTCLKAQLAAYDGLASQIEQWRAALRQRVERGARVAETLECAKTERLKELQTLAAAFVLSQGSRRAVEELDLNAKVMGHLQEWQQQLTDETRHYQQRNEALERLVTTIHTHLKDALKQASVEAPEASDDTTGQPDPQSHQPDNGKQRSVPA